MVGDANQIIGPEEPRMPKVSTAVPPSQTLYMEVQRLYVIPPEVVIVVHSNINDLRRWDI